METIRQLIRRNVLQSLLILLITSTHLITSTALADTQGETVAEGVSSALGNAMRDIGMDISGGSLPAIEHLFSNWENLKNPCGNARRLIYAFLRDAKEGQQPLGINFANTMIKIFDFPRSSFSQLEHQGSLVSKRLWKKYRTQKRLRDLLGEINKLCTKKKPKPKTSLGPSTKPGATAAGGTIGSGGSNDGWPADPKPTPVDPKPAPKPKSAPKKPAKIWTAEEPCPECQGEADAVKQAQERIKEIDGKLEAIRKQLAENSKQQDKLTEQKATLEVELESQEGTFAEGYDQGTGIRIRAENVGDGTVRVTKTAPGKDPEVTTRDSSSSKRIKKNLEKINKQLADLKAEKAKLEKQETDLQNQLKDAETKLEAAKTALKNCVAQKCNKGQASDTAVAMPGGDGTGKPEEPKQEWSVNNPCPPCKPEADAVVKLNKRIQLLKDDAKKVGEKLKDNRKRQKDINQEKTELDAELKGQQGAFAESTDTTSGTRIRAENVGGGKVQITTTYSDGRIDTRTRSSAGKKRINKRQKVLDKLLKGLKDKEEALKTREKNLGDKLTQAEADLKNAEQALKDCIKKKCGVSKPETNATSGTPTSPLDDLLDAETSTAGKPASDIHEVPLSVVIITRSDVEKYGYTKPPCQTSMVHSPIAIGPKSEIGGGLTKVVQEAASGLLGQAMGGLLGGSGIGLGGGDDDEESKGQEPEIQDDPVENKQTFKVPGTDIEIDVGAMFDENGKLLISSKINNAPGKGTYQDISLHNIDCQALKPFSYAAYGLYLEWSLSVQYTTRHYVDGQLVSEEITPWMGVDSGKELLGTGVDVYKGEGDETIGGIWSHFGFNRATEGVLRLGAKYNVNYDDLRKPTAVSIKITQPNNDPVTAIPLNLMACPNEDGGVSFLQVSDMLKFKQDMDGGSVKIDPPTIPVSAGDDGDDEFESVAGELAPYGSKPRQPRNHNTRNQLAMDTYTSPYTGKTMSELCPKWEIFEAADDERWYKGDKDQAGEDFMEAFIHAFGGRNNVDYMDYDDEDFDGPGRGKIFIPKIQFKENTGDDALGSIESREPRLPIEYKWEKYKF